VFVHLTHDRPAAQLLPLLEDDYATTWRLEALRELSTPAERVIRIFSNFMSSCNFLPVCVRTVAVLAITHLDVAIPLVRTHELHLFLQLPLFPFPETARRVSGGPQPRDAVLVLMRPAIRPVRGQVGKSLALLSPFRVSARLGPCRIMHANLVIVRVFNHSNLIRGVVVAGDGAAVGLVVQVIQVLLQELSHLVAPRR
jgi:hypothetical protein